ncbi:hypothetical protein LTR86_004939 [Recurvomyces mirabilis]|nr:hypothetical protein LTR86_004939 [Recurvomyces mirabilis]
MATAQVSRRPIYLVLDWDSTLTTRDTMSLLGNVPKVRGRGMTPATAAYPAWDSFFSAYIDDYKAHKAAHYPQSQEACHEEYSQWLQSLDVVELASSRRVSRSGFFTNSRSQHVRDVASDALLSGQLALRTGWKDLLRLFSHDESMLPPTSSVSILSVNFSATFIRSALRCAVPESGAAPRPEQNDILTMVNDMVIEANEIEGLDSSEGSSGRLYSRIRTAQHKLARITTLRQEHQAEQPIVVYVGDSATDYECLRAADIGVWICDCAERDYQKRFAEIFKPLGLDVFSPIAIERWESDHVPGKTCLWTPGLDRIVELLSDLGMRTSTQSNTK